jgi:hypothetical protein
MRPQEFRVAAQYRLGIPVFASEGDCVSCGRPSDIFADHAISCAYEGERISRHNRLRDAIYTAAQSAALNPQRELRNLLPNGESRPADVFLPSWIRGRDAALDVTVINPPPSVPSITLGK